MEFLIHFVFQLVKIAILGGFYLLILLMIARHPSLSKKKYYINLRSKADSKLFAWFAICVILFIWQFTYWGNHGLGDYSRVPIGNGKEIEQINYMGMYIRPVGHEHETLSIENCSLHQDYCFGLMSKKGGYFIWNLNTNGVQKFASHSAYTKQLKDKNLSNQIMFHDFTEAYNSFWGGWRFWLLP